MIEPRDSDWVYCSAFNCGTVLVGEHLASETDKFYCRSHSNIGLMEYHEDLVSRCWRPDCGQMVIFNNERPLINGPTLCSRHKGEWK